MKYKYMRDETEDEYGFKQLQDKIMEIAEYIDKVCVDNKISYCLMSGSTLGALRHKGFIPWDDDMDIFMKPDEYKKFKEFFEKNGDTKKYYLQELYKRDDYIASAKLRLNNTAYIEESSKDMKIHQGIFIDIFILHNTPDNDFLSFIQCMCAKYVLARGQMNKKNNYKGKKLLLLKLLNILPKEFLIKHCLKKQYKYDNKTTKRVCHFMGHPFYKKGIYDSKYFLEYRRTKFEKIELNIPKYSEEYLTDRFGDYMKLPSKESIKKAQHAWKWDISKDFSNYVNKERDFSDEKYLV